MYIRTLLTEHHKAVVLCHYCKLCVQYTHSIYSISTRLYLQIKCLNYFSHAGSTLFLVCLHPLTNVSVINYILCPPPAETTNH